MRGVTIAASAALILILGLTKSTTAQCGREYDMLAPLVDTYTAKNCGDNDVGGGVLSDEERQTVVDLLEFIRQSIAEECLFGYEKVKPGLFSFLKYDCALEKELKFECTAASATSDDKVWRQKAYSQPKRNEKRTSLFLRVFPKKWQMHIKNGLPDASKMSPELVSSMMLFLDSSVHSVGCYVQTCGDDEYIACKTGKDLVIGGRTEPLYTQDVSCSDENCKAFTQTELKVCDANLHLCGVRTQVVKIDYELAPTPPRPPPGPPPPPPTTTTTTMTTMFTITDNSTAENTTMDINELRNITGFDLTSSSNGLGFLLELVFTGLALIGFMVL
uniref:SCP domain-containing protein n=1 Tax=Panagrellus redivivus TaxID=6233 RepID=A0A7E4VP33_PANRE